MPAFRKSAPGKKTASKAALKKTPRLKGLQAIDAVLSRRTITIRRATEQAITALVGRGEFSAFAQVALEHELQRKRIDDWLAEQETARGGGSLSADALEFAEKAWQSRG